MFIYWAAIPHDNNSSRRNSTTKRCKWMEKQNQSVTKPEQQAQPQLLQVKAQNAQDSAIEANLSTLISSHSDPAKLLKQLTNSAIDNAIVELNEDITRIALKVQRIDDRLKELEDAVDTIATTQLVGLRRITLLEQGAKTTPGVST
jgi:hypothetical protein